MRPSKRIIVLGSSSWIGHYIVDALTNCSEPIDVVGVSRSGMSQTNIKTVQLANHERTEICALIDTIRPHALVNLARGEDDDGFNLHLALIDKLNAIGCHYAFASSSNAVDANCHRPHDEHEKPNSQSDYGKFKGKCELALAQSSSGYSIFRFAAVHGWAPNRVARTEEFLLKLKAGDNVSIARGVVQNRCFVGDVAAMMVGVIRKSGEGLFNLGTVDYSEEIDFLRWIAVAFGYSEERVIAADQNDFKAIMLPSRILELLGDQFRKSEQDTVRAVRNQLSLRKYVA